MIYFYCYKVISVVNTKFKKTMNMKSKIGPPQIYIYKHNKIHYIISTHQRNCINILNLMYIL